ncbi:atp18p [Saccharomyces arboricola H-6]|uniref:Atp18p n=1 Tax=Saccharomyces arboricola (strain H-6 / AS 2.3317 / CBS 10644) TaxID=1160507 RepID=J8Q1G8_SACAR|nr:atp18p [Saccharomyces arboricola H-6]
MLKRFPTPILKVYWPFFVAGAVVYYGVSKAADFSSSTKEFINDPRNPRFAKGGKFVEVD